MNKYLIFFLLLFSCANVYASEPISVIGGVAQIIGLNPVSLEDIKGTGADSFLISNSVIVINNLSEWQNWEADVEIQDGVVLQINNIDISNDGEVLKHVSDPINNNVIISVKDADNLYTVDPVKESFSSTNISLNMVRETNYKNVFADSLGDLLENIRSNNSNDRMLLAMDKAVNMQEINSIMNSSYHFNPIILMNPIKTINRAVLNDMLIDKKGSGVGVNIDYILSGKINNFGTHLYIDEKYNDLYFRVGLDFNSFAYKDDFNEFDGLSYGLNICAKQYIQNFWIDGLFGINRSDFNADNIYNNGDISNKPKGISEYGRLVAGYDYTKFSDVTISTFVGMLLQHYDIMGKSDNAVNLHTGLVGKYNFVMDGIKYEYGATIATDEKIHLDIGLNVGITSVADRAGVFLRFNAFKDEIDINYKFSANAKIEF